jgi:peptide/nickel transport system permease protein
MSTATTLRPTPVPAAKPRRVPAVVGLVVGRLGQLGGLLLAISTLLFFLLRLTGDPATVLAGEDADPAAVERVREHYGLDRPLPVQFVTFLANLVRLDFGASLANGRPALELVAERVAPTMSLAGAAISIDVVVAICLGTWLGARAHTPGRRVGSVFVFIGQGIPAYVIGLVLIQVFAVELGLLPSVGAAGPASWVLPSVTLAAFLAPQLVRVVAARVGETMAEDYIRTARASGAGGVALLARHALPNALLATVAMVGTQFAYLMSGALITEVIFGWPGLGRLLVESVRNLDFPVVQAAVFVVAVMVFLINTILDTAFRLIDPRLRRSR